MPAAVASNQLEGRLRELEAMIQIYTSSLEAHIGAGDAQIASSVQACAGNESW